MAVLPFSQLAGVGERDGKMGMAFPWDCGFQGLSDVLVREFGEAFLSTWVVDHGTRLDGWMDGWMDEQSTLSVASTGMSTSMKMLYRQTTNFVATVSKRELLVSSDVFPFRSIGLL